VSHHVNVPVFVPHAGCPHLCSFCNQRTISGELRPPTPEEVSAVFAAARESLGERMHSAQLAFFGGSFTGVDPEYRRALLKAACPFVGPGGFSGIRVSTRPDLITPDILAELRDYGVTAVELGAQSMRDEVLKANDRGHSAREVAHASRLIKKAGLELGLQMMTGLYGDDNEGAMDTARALAALEPDTVRVYPTVVLEGTRLARLWREGRYAPQSLEEAVALGARLLEVFHSRGIRVIRLGLQDEEGLRQGMLAGPHHPALRELCESRLMLQKALDELDAGRIPPGPLLIKVHPGCLSKMIGQHRCNIAALAGRGYRARVEASRDIPPLALILSSNRNIPKNISI